jgi:hypothetical protein
MTDSDPAKSFTPEAPIRDRDQETSRWGEPVKLRTVDEAAELCKRAPSTILNLISRYQLPVKTGWSVRNRRRKRRHLLAPHVCAWLQQVTLLGNKVARQRPPR